MVTRRKSEPEEKPTRRRPATTPEVREQQLVGIAVDLAEKQLRDGTASAQVISHFLKLSSSREHLEQERLSLENDLTRAKIESLSSQARMEELYSKAINAMRSYGGQEPMDDLDDED